MTSGIKTVWDETGTGVSESSVEDWFTGQILSSNAYDPARYNAYTFSRMVYELVDQVMRERKERTYR